MSAFGSCKFPGIPADRTRLVGGGVLDAPSRKAAVFAGSTLLSGWVLRDCTPRALPRASRSGRHVGLRPPRNDKSGAGTVLTIACANRRFTAGRGMPLPYNGVYNRREYPEICSCQWRSLSAATDAIGWCIFIGTLYELEVPSRDCHVTSLLAMTIRKCIPF